MADDLIYTSIFDRGDTIRLDVSPDEDETEEEKRKRLEEEERKRLEEEERKRLEEEEVKLQQQQRARFEEEEQSLQQQKQEVGYRSIFNQDTPQTPIPTTRKASDLPDTPEMLQRKLAYGFAQEPTIAGSLFRLGKARVKSLVTDQTYDEAAREIEAARQEEIRKEFPDLFGREEDAAILAGRMGLALADPVTLFVPWLKAAKAGKLATGALGAGVAVGDTALREEALYGETSGTSLGLAAVLGGASSIFSSALLSGRKGVKETFETINDQGLVVKKSIDIGGELVQNPLLKIRNRKKLIEEANKYDEVGNLVASRHSSLINDLINNNNNAGYYYTQRSIIKQDVTNLRKELADAKDAAQGLKTASVTKLEKDLAKATEKYDLNEQNLQEVLFEQLPEDFGNMAFITFENARKQGIFTDEGVAQYFMQELTRPLIGAAGGFAIGVTTADEDDTMSYVYTTTIAGAMFGEFGKRINRANYNLKDSKIASQVLDEADRIYKRTFKSVAKDIFAGTHSAKLQAGVKSVREFGAKLFNIQGGGLKQDTVLGESVEEAKMIQLNKWGSVALGELIGNNSPSTVIAAGRILNAKNMADDATHSFLKKGDLENAEAVRLADDLEKFTNDFKKYVENVGIKFTEEDQYGLTQILKKDLNVQLGKSQEDIAEAFKIQFINDINNNKVQFQTTGRFAGKYVHIDDRAKPENLVRSYEKPLIDEALGKTPSRKPNIGFDEWASNKAKLYINGQTQVRQHSLWARELNLLDDADLTKKLFRDRGDMEEDVIITAARHFENQRVLYDQEARAFLSKKGYFEDDPVLTLQTLINQTVPVVEFARVFGAKGEGLQSVFKNIKQDINNLAPGASIDTNKSLQELATKQIEDVKNSVDAYFGFYGMDKATKNDKVLTSIAALQFLLSTTRLTKVALPSLGDLVQTFKNSGFGAAREAAIRQISKRQGEDIFVPSEMLGLRGKRPTEKLASDETDVSDVVFNNRLYNGLLERELKNYIIEINPNNSKQVWLQKNQQRFFEIVQLGRITRFAREFAYDAGAMRAWKLSQKIDKNGQIPKRFQNEAARLGLDLESLRYLKKFNKLDDVQGDEIGERLINRAGFKSAERDALIPTVGNRRLFSQSRDPYVRFLGTFLSWAQAKTSQTNALISRVESGDAAMAVRMLGAIPIFMAVRELQLDLNASEQFKKSSIESESPDISDDLKRFGDSIIFSAEVLPWYVDKAVNSYKGYGSNDSMVTGLAPVLGLMNSLAKEGSQTVFGGAADIGASTLEGIPRLVEGDVQGFIEGYQGVGDSAIEGLIGTAENTIPFFKDLNRGKGFLNPTLNLFGKPVGMSFEDWLKGERPPLELEFELNPLEVEFTPRDLNFEGGLLDKNNPVSSVANPSSSRKDVMGSQSYDVQSNRQPINPFTNKPYTDIYYNQSK
jgi:hypothetical protein